MTRGSLKVTSRHAAVLDEHDTGGGRVRGDPPVTDWISAVSTAYLGFLGIFITI
jgi:hypothetical protein